MPNKGKCVEMQKQMQQQYLARKCVWRKWHFELVFMFAPLTSDLGPCYRLHLIAYKAGGEGCADALIKLQHRNECQTMCQTQSAANEGLESRL